MKRILFVDDERAVLEAMQRSFRRRFDVVIAGGGVDGLAMLETDPTIAVVISDMRMPGMDGAELLARIQERHPTTVRIVLSGYAELEVAVRAACVAHVFLAKPCPPDDLRATLARACTLHATICGSTNRGTAQ